VADQPQALVQLAPPASLRMPSGDERSRLERQARLLAWGGIAYHFVEFAVAIAAGIAAGSIALIGFGADSLIESLAGFVVLWLFTGRRVGSVAAERRAQQLIAASFFGLAAYVGVESIRSLVGGHEPDVSWIGIGLAAFTAATMPLLARVKRRVASKLNSSAAAVRRDNDLRIACSAGREAAGGPGRRDGHAPQPDPDRAALPPRGRVRRLAGRVRRRHRAQGDAPAAGGRDAVIA
jgi:hypothetical protein